jgi:hypothetical protein
VAEVVGPRQGLTNVDLRDLARERAERLDLVYEQIHVAVAALEAAVRK